MSLLTDIVCITSGIIQSVFQYKEKSLLLQIEEQTRRTLIWCGILVIFMLILLAGIGFILAGVYTLLASSVGSGYSALIVGIIVSLLALILMVTIKNSMR